MVSKPLRRNTHNTDNVLHGVRHRRKLIVDRHELPYQIFNFVGELVPLLRRCISPFASRRTTFGTVHGDERRRGRGPIIFILTTHVSGYSIIRPRRFRNSPVASAVSSVCPLRSKCGPVNITVSGTEQVMKLTPLCHVVLISLLGCRESIFNDKSQVLKHSIHSFI